MDPTTAPLTGSTTFDHVLAFLGALVPLMSAIAGLLNGRVRSAQSEGQEVSPALLNAASVVNLLAVNLDKAKQLASLAKGQPTPTTTQGVLNAEPAAEEPKPGA